MKKQKRIATAVISAVLLLSLFVSSAYISHATGHCCTGSWHCEICKVVLAAETVLEGLRLLAAAMLALLLPCLLRCIFYAIKSVSRPVRFTPVSWKVRLND